MTMALIRFVNGLLDPLQKRDKSLPLSVLAASADLPTVFVEVRHWGTHESNLPGAEILKDMGIRALEWLWRNYWNKKEDSTDIVALFKNGSVDTKTVVTAFEKNEEDLYEKLFVELAEEEDFGVSRISLNGLMSSLSETLPTFPESFIDYVIQALSKIPSCEILSSAC
jgi:Las1-like